MKNKFIYMLLICFSNYSFSDIEIKFNNDQSSSKIKIHYFNENGRLITKRNFKFIFSDKGKILKINGNFKGIVWISTEDAYYSYGTNYDNVIRVDCDKEKGIIYENKFSIYNSIVLLRKENKIKKFFSKYRDSLEKE